MAGIAALEAGTGDGSMSSCTISYRSFWQARGSGVIPGAKWAPSIDESKKTSEKDLVSTLQPFSFHQATHYCVHCH